MTKEHIYERITDNEDRDCYIKRGDLIRCRDCKYYEIAQLKIDYTDDRRYKPSVCVKGQYAVKRKENWFCADAEGKE